MAGVVRVFLGGGVSRGKGRGQEAGGRMLGSVLPNGDSVDWVRVGVMSTALWGRCGGVVGRAECGAHEKTLWRIPQGREF